MELPPFASSTTTLVEASFSLLPSSRTVDGAAAAPAAATGPANAPVENVSAIKTKVKSVFMNKAGMRSPRFIPWTQGICQQPKRLNRLGDDTTFVVAVCACG